MAVEAYTSADLLNLFNRDAGRPEGDGIPPADKYDRLSKAQDYVYMQIMNTCPRVLYGPPTAMVTSDGGYTFTFGTDNNGYALFPLGKAQIYPSLNAVPNYPWVPGVDYLDEGTQIRMPNGIAYSGTVYWYGAQAPPPINESLQPSLQPPQSRTLIVTKAVKSFAQEFLRSGALADEMTARWNEEWPVYITMMRKHFQGLQSLGPLSWPYSRMGSAIGPGVWR